MLNRAAFKFTVDINSIASTAAKSTVNTTGTSFMDTMLKLAEAKEPLTITPVTRQAPAVTLSKKVDKNLNVDHLIQNKNECGSTSLAMMLKYFGKDVSNYHNWFSSDAVGHSPGELATYAKNHGMTVRQKENGTLEDLAKLVDQGLPAMVLGIDGGGQTTTVESYLNNFVDNAKSAHWMVVTGYKRDDYGKITDVYVNDPNSMQDKCMKANDFLTKFWNNNLVPDGHRYFMSMAPSGSYQAGSLNTLQHTDQLDGWYSKANDAYKSIYSLIKTGKSAEKAAKQVLSKLGDIGDTIADAADKVSDWFSSWG